MTGWAAAVSLAALMIASETRAEDIIFETRPEPGVAVRVVRTPNLDVWLRQPFGHDIRLRHPRGQLGIGSGPPELRQIDFDLDGHLDIAVDYPGARSDDPLLVIRYRPARRHYEILPLPQAPELQCDWRDAAPDPPARLLTLQCRRGISHIIETVRFNRFGAPWLETRLTEGGLSDAGRYPYIPINSRFSRWDETGEQVALGARDTGGNAIFMTIPTPRATLFEHPTHSAETAGYLVRGDGVELLDRLDDWLFVRYEGQSGAIERWIRVEEAFNLAARFGLDASAADHGLVLAGNDMSGALADVFPVTLTNTGDAALSLDRPELHIILGSDEHGAFWAHSLGSRASATIAPGERLVVEKGPPLLDHGAHLLPHPMPNEFETSVELIPVDLVPGEYNFRLAVTSPSLDVPIYAEETFVFSFPLAESKDVMAEEPEH